MEDKAKIERCKYSHPHFKINNTWYVKLLQSMDQPEEE